MGTQSIYQGAVAVKTFLESLPELPMILTETRETPKKGAHLITDNYGGIRSIVEHLIKVHNLKKIAFLGGERCDGLITVTLYCAVFLLRLRARVCHLSRQRPHIPAPQASVAHCRPQPPAEAT